MDTKKEGINDSGEPCLAIAYVCAKQMSKRNQYAPKLDTVKANQIKYFTEVTRFLKFATLDIIVLKQMEHKFARLVPVFLNFLFYEHPFLCTLMLYN